MLYSHKVRSLAVLIVFSNTRVIVTWLHSLYPPSRALQPAKPTVGLPPLSLRCLFGRYSFVAAVSVGYRGVLHAKHPPACTTINDMPTRMRWHHGVFDPCVRRQPGRPMSAARTCNLVSECNQQSNKVVGDGYDEVFGVGCWWNY